MKEMEVLKFSLPPGFPHNVQSSWKKLDQEQRKNIGAKGDLLQQGE